MKEILVHWRRIGGKERSLKLWCTPRLSGGPPSVALAKEGYSQLVYPAMAGIGNLRNPKGAYLILFGLFIQ
jgi:hypothetical protein